MVRIYFCKIKNPLPNELWEYYHAFLPPIERQKNSKYLRWEDRHAHLIGKVLLRHGLTEFGINTKKLNTINYTSFGRPYLNAPIDFNISHSGEMVVCALSNENKIGIDIEKIDTTINVSDFDSIFSADEWQYLKNAYFNHRVFFKLWVRKESIVKAIGEGITMPLNQINILPESVVVKNKHWSLFEFLLDPDYCFCLTTVNKYCSIQNVPVNIYSPVKSMH